LWIVVSISAGICEEIVFRGYFQHQFAAYTRSMGAAVLLQGLVFGVGHSYQGLKQVILICVLGILYGWFAAWRRNLRSNMMVHAWTDIWNGWLSRLERLRCLIPSDTRDRYGHYDLNCATQRPCLWSTCLAVFHCANFA